MDGRVDAAQRTGTNREGVGDVDPLTVGNQLFSMRCYHFIMITLIFRSLTHCFSDLVGLFKMLKQLARKIKNKCA
jgi:hypothetical protein